MIEVRYDGSYPSLCSGNLTVIIGGVKFPFPNYCLRSGGCWWYDAEGDWTEEGPWSISRWNEDIPEELRPAVLEAINSAIPCGCCGGCI